MDQEEPDYLFVHCGECLHSWSLGKLPMTFEEIMKAISEVNTKCSECGEEQSIRMGPPGGKKYELPWRCGQVVIGDVHDENFRNK